MNQTKGISEQAIQNSAFGSDPAHPLVWNVSNEANTYIQHDENEHAWHDTIEGLETTELFEDLPFVSNTFSCLTELTSSYR